MASPTATQAAQALQEAEAYEEGLTLRTAGLTTMLWGLVSAGIFMTYGTAVPYFVDIGAPWALSFMWMPWVLAGIGITHALWSSHSVVLAAAPDHSGIWGSLGFTFAFLLIAGALVIGLNVGLDLDWPVSTIMIIVTGCFAAVVAGAERMTWAYNDVGLWVGAAGLVLAGTSIGLAEVPEGATDLIGALLVAIVWITAGLITYRRG